MILNSSSIAYILFMLSHFASSDVLHDDPDTRKSGEHELDSDHQQRIAILCEPSPITYMSGLSGRFRNMMQHFTDHHSDTHNIELVTVENVHPDPPRRCFHDKIPIHYTVGVRLPSYPSLTVSFDINFRVLRILFPRKTKNFDLIHCTSPGFFVVSAILCSRLYQLPLVLSYHTHLPLYVRSYFPAPFNIILEWCSWRLLRMTHWFADVTLVTSKQMQKEFASHNIPSVVWQKGVNTTQFHPRYKSSKMRQKMSDGNPDDLLLVYVGRLAREKRVMDIKSILQRMNIVCPTRLCIVGSGPEEEILENYFRGTPTKFLGALDGDQLSEAYASADLFVMPSDSETLGFVVLESMASGVPVVASRAGGLVDLIQDGTTGYLVPTGDSDLFVDRIQKLQNDPDLVRSMSLASRHFTEQWSWEASMEKIKDHVYPLAMEKCTQRFSPRLFRWLASWLQRERRSSKSDIEL
jgi:sulfoquinovosyltransferase